MKKLLIVITALFVSTGVLAQHGYHGHGGHRNHGNNEWAGPLIGGIILGTIITNSQRQVIVQQPPVIVQQPPVFVYPIQNYYSCLVQVQDPYSGVIRNEVRTCVR
jgi:hypothetical protein